MNSKILKSLELALRNFNLQELCDIALRVFPETSWDSIKQTIIAHGENLSGKNVVKLLVNIAENLRKEEIEERTSLLYLYAVGKTLKKQWIAIELSDQIPVTRREIEDQIKGAIKRTGMLASVHLIKFKDKSVLSVQKKTITKKRGLIKQNPVYFQFFLNEPYLFSTRKNIDNKILDAITESLGFAKFKFCSLTGPNVSDLLTLLKNKQFGTSNISLLSSPPKITPTFKKRSFGVDYSQQKEREEYANKIYGEKPAQLQSLTVSLKNMTWTQTDDFDKMNGESLDGVKAVFQGPNIAEFFKEMITLGAVSDPIPEYMKALLYTGKNNLKITENN